MALRITGDGLSLSSTSSGAFAYINVSNLSSTITISFDGVGSGATDVGGAKVEYYDYLKINRKGSETTYRASSKSISCSPSDWGYLNSDTSGRPYLSVEAGEVYNLVGGPLLTLGDVYLNGTKIDTVKTYTYSDTYKIYFYVNPNTYYPKINSFSNITIQSGGWNGFAVAGASVMQVATVTFGNTKSDDPNNHYDVSVSIYGGGNSTNDFTVTRVNNTTIKITNIVTPTAEESAYSLSVTVKVVNRYSSSTSQSKTVTIYPYHLPRLYLNRAGEVSYVSRCQQDGSADGLGEYGHLHLVWDVSKINTTGSGTVNTLQSYKVVLNSSTTLTPTSGSISSGYLDYIFPLAIATQGNLTITLTDTRKTNTITGLNVPKGSMPLSLFDDGSNIGIAFGCMATEKGAWVYMPFYLQSSTSGSTKMFRICVYDDGTIKAVAI